MHCNAGASGAGYFVAAQSSVVCDLDLDIKENLEAMKSAGHTRYPLCRGDLDDCLGLIHIKDIFRWREPVSEIDFMKLKRNVAVFLLRPPLRRLLNGCCVRSFIWHLLSMSLGETSV